MLPSRVIIDLAMIFTVLSIKLTELVMIFLLKLVKKRKHGIKCLFVYPVIRLSFARQHIHDDRFKYAVKAGKRVVYRLSGGFGICVLLKVAELLPYSRLTGYALKMRLSR